MSTTAMAAGSFACRARRSDACSVASAPAWVRAAEGRVAGSLAAKAEVASAAAIRAERLLMNMAEGFPPGRECRQVNDLEPDRLS